MHYYKFNIADYRKDTSHLTPIEHYIYRTLIDWYYLDECPIPKETQSVMRRLCLGYELLPQLENILSDFFILGENGYSHGRIDEEIGIFHQKASKNKVNGNKGGRPKKTQSVISGLPNGTENNPTVTLTINHKPLTNNQEEKKKPITSKGSRLSAEQILNQEWGQNALDARSDWSKDDVRREFEAFKDYWIAVPGSKGVKADWLATWRNWCRRSNRKGEE